MRMIWKVVPSPSSRQEYHRAVGPSRESVNSAIFEASILTGVRRCIEWFASQVDRKARICDSASGPSVYRGYGYGMMSYSRSSGRTGKGFGSGWLTSGGLGRGFGGESTRDRVSGGEDCTRETFDCS